MRDAMRMVSEFHQKYGYHVGELFEAPDRQVVADVLETKALMMGQWAKSNVASRHVGTFRAALMVEELSEVLSALATGDIVELADGLADLAYVVLGTAVTFGIPLPKVLDEVHRSNMTKDVGGPKPAKGASYSPPDVAGIVLGRPEP